MPDTVILTNLYVMQRIGFLLHRNKHGKFILFKLACMFKHIYVDIEHLKKIISSFTQDANTKNDFLEFVELLIKNGIMINLPLGKMLEDNVGKYPKELGAPNEVYYYLYIKEVIERKSCIVTEEPFDVFNEKIISRFFKEETEFIKSSYKFPEIGLFIIDYLIPNFYVEKEKYPVFIESIKNNSSFFNSKIREFLERFKGYRLLGEEEKKIIGQIEEEKQKLNSLQKTILDRFLGELGTEAAGITLSLFGAILPLGIAKFLLSKLIQETRIRHEHLEWLVYLLALTTFQKKRETTEGECILCKLSTSEIQNLTEKECEDIMLNHEYCIAHTIIYLNLKELRRDIKQFLVLIKKYENDPALRLGTELGTFD